MSITLGYDAVNWQAIPPGSQAAGYTTGAGIAWPAAAWAAFPNAVRICQNASASDTTADVLDVESGAATVADVPGWFRSALANYKAAVRPGQRYPAVYASASNITPIANELVSAGIVANGPGLWVAHWGVGEPTAASDVTDSGPYPIIGFQYANPGPYDLDVWLTAWLQTVSVATPPTPPPPPPVASGVQVEWLWCPKCQCLYYGPNLAQSKCAAGGTHGLPGINSYNYNLTYNGPLIP